MFVFVVKRYAVREAKKWRYAVRNAKIERYAVRKGGGGCHPHKWFIFYAISGIVSRPDLRHFPYFCHFKLLNRLCFAQTL